MYKTVNKSAHEVLQKMIVVFLGLLTMAVIFQSCASHKSCAAYNEVDIEQAE